MVQGSLARQYATVQQRAGAQLIDALLVGGIFLFFAVAIDRQRALFIALRDSFEPGEAPVVVQQQVVLIIALILLNYFPLMWAWKGQTVGKMLVGLEVVTTGGGRISLPRAYLRLLFLLFDTFVLTLGYWIAAFNRERRTLHDFVAGTVVVRASAPALEAHGTPPSPPARMADGESAGQPLERGPSGPDTIACPACGRQLPGDAMFCGGCGHRLR
jgi:uncharacterized RDD family membrane protein YckC